MNIPPNEHGVVRVFALDLPADQADTFDTQLADGTYPLQNALGASSFDADKSEIFNTADLGDLGLAGYLIDGNGVPEAQVEPFRPQLDALTDHVAIVYSSAFQGVEQMLTVKSPLRHIATFNEASIDVTFEKLPSDSAKPYTSPVAEKRAKKPVSDAAMSGRVATVALLVIFAFTAVFIWMAG